MYTLEYLVFFTTITFILSEGCTIYRLTQRRKYGKKKTIAALNTSTLQYIIQFLKCEFLRLQPTLVHSRPYVMCNENI